MSIWQKSQRRVHWSPPMRKVASRSSQHSKMLGQPASWQTVCRPSDFTSFCSSVYCGPIFARVLIHSGLRSMGVSALRTSRRSSLRPSGAGRARTWLGGGLGHPVTVRRGVGRPNRARDPVRARRDDGKQRRDHQRDEQQHGEVRRAVGEAHRQPLVAGDRLARGAPTLSS